MDTVTYPNPTVVQFIQRRMVPVQVAYNAQPLASEFNVKWTPTLITLDSEGKEHHRTLGFLPPRDLIPSLMLGIAKCHFDAEQLDAAISILEELLDEYPQSDSAPEAIYLRGVSRYKSAHDAKPLKEAYERLQKEYPSSEWTKRASPYRLL
jgi:tetratricopeptide (TPR) repeat protein